MSDLIAALLGDPIGRWFLYFGAFVGFAILAIRNRSVSRKKLEDIAKDLGLVKHEVKNNHSTNLREEADDRHQENTSKLDAVLTGMDELRQNDRNLFQLIVGLTGRVDDVDERTQEHPLHRKQDAP